MAKKLTQKQAKFIKGVAEGKPAYKAAAEAYDAKDLTVANAIAVENLQKPSIREALDEAMVKAGITPELIIAPVAEALNHRSLDYRLKGHDRIVKLVQPAKEGGNTINNFGTIVTELKDKYE